MQLRYIYAKDINRQINGVIKVAQDDESNIEQELSEYIITRELRSHFDTFFSNYERSIDTPTDKIGVWISGFFGSGKSHFLKMLSYLLENKVVAGKKAVEYFSDKFDDPMMFAQLERCVSVPTDTILFNIDSKSPLNKDKTAILRVFAKVFYEHQGFDGNDLKVAKLEQFLSEQGQYDAFKLKFREINGTDWIEGRDSFAFFEDDIVNALVTATGMSETSARNWFNGTESADISIEQLVAEIKKYVDSKGNDYRLLFMIDEVGQYIGSDSSLMLNLQTIVEEIGSKCGGRVWVIVTSQEAIDSITNVVGNDFSKIQGRFNTRLSLSSQSVDEVIKRRILAKTPDAEAMLKASYGTNNAILKNLYTFRADSAVGDMGGYTSEYDFIETYPFVPYQFRLMQNVLAEIRKHGNSGKHLSGGERSMLSGFQEAAQKIQDKDETALVPFYLFYDTVNTFLESTIRRVIDRCQTQADNDNGLKQFDVDVLKLLYLIRYIDDIKSNVDNVVTLMVDNINADKINMRKDVQDALDRLLKQNYIARNGDTYNFLTDDEQDIAKEIANTMVDSAAITNKLSDIIFGDLYALKKVNYGKNIIEYDRFIDDTVVGQQTGNMKLRIVTAVSDIYTADDQHFIMKSGQDNEAIVVLSDAYPYFTELESAMKIRKYVMTRNVAQLPDAIQQIIRNRQQEATNLERRASEFIAKSIVDGRFFVAGSKATPTGSTVKDKIDAALQSLVANVYTKIDLVDKNYDDDSQLLAILNDTQTSLGSISTPNRGAMDEVETYLNMMTGRNVPVSMQDIQSRFNASPYGWREIDIAAVVLSLVHEQKLTLSYGGTTIQPTEKSIVDNARQKSLVGKTAVKIKQSVGADKLKLVRDFLKDYFNETDVPSDEDGLVAFVKTRFEAQKDEYKSILSFYDIGNYPDKNLVENAISTIGEVLNNAKDNQILFTYLVAKSDNLLDLSEDMADVNAFFKSQKDVFDNAAKLASDLKSELTYLQTEPEAKNALNTINEILVLPKPYRRISELPTCIQTIKTIYDKLLDAKKADVNVEIQSAMAEVHQAGSDVALKTYVDQADAAFDLKKNSVANAQKLTELDAMYVQINNTKTQYLAQMAAAKVQTAGPQKKVASINRSTVCTSVTLESESDIDDYLAEIKQKLMQSLNDNDVVNII